MRAGIRAVIGPWHNLHKTNQQRRGHCWRGKGRSECAYFANIKRWIGVLMNDLRTTTAMANQDGTPPRMERIRMAQSKGAGQMSVKDVAGHSGCAGQGNEEMK